MFGTGFQEHFLHPLPSPPGQPWVSWHCSCTMGHQPHPPGSPALTAFHVWVQLFPHPGRPPASFAWFPTCWDDLSRVFAFDEVLCFMQCFNASVSLMFYDYVKYNNCSPVRNPTDDPNEMLIMFSHQLNKEERQACSIRPLVICIGNHTNTSVIPSATPVFHKRSRGC